MVFPFVPQYFGNKSLKKIRLKQSMDKIYPNEKRTENHILGAGLIGSLMALISWSVGLEVSIYDKTARLS